MQQYYSANALQIAWEEVIFPMRPSTCPDSIEDIYPEKIVDALGDYVYKDLAETLECFRLQLWTATALMSFRLIEGELRVHADVDLGYSGELKNLGQIIDVLWERGYPAASIEFLQRIREDRNLAMHAGKRFSPDWSTEIFKNALHTVMLVYNFY